MIFGSTVAYAWTGESCDLGTHTPNNFILPVLPGNLTIAFFLRLDSYPLHSQLFLWNFIFNSPLLQCLPVGPCSKSAQLAGQSVSRRPRKWQVLQSASFLWSMMAKCKLWERQLLLLLPALKKIRLGFPASGLALHCRAVNEWTWLWFGLLKCFWDL